MSFKAVNSNICVNFYLGQKLFILVSGNNLYCCRFFFMLNTSGTIEQTWYQKAGRQMHTNLIREAFKQIN